MRPFELTLAEEDQREGQPIQERRLTEKALRLDQIDPARVEALQRFRALFWAIGSPLHIRVRQLLLGLCGSRLRSCGAPPR